MDSRVVNRRIKTDIWPLLREHGFSHFTSRTAWRYLPEQVHVVNFQSFNAHQAGVMNITTFSFHLNLGVYLAAIPSQYGKDVPLRNGQPAPAEWACHLRRMLGKPIVQRTLESAARPDVGRDNWRWYWIVDGEGTNLGELMDAARAALGSQALPWFARFTDPREVLRTLVEEEDSIPDTWGFGRLGSPSRNYFIGYVARSLGETDIARRGLTAALESGCYETVRPRLLSDLAQLRGR
jgi:hypothetical protein